MALILNIDTATEVCSVCLAEDGEILAIQENHERNTHAAVITLLIDQLFQKTGKKKTELSAVAISSGPGSYTGLRIGTSIAKGICYALNIPLIEIPTLQVMSYGASLAASAYELYCPMMDARRQEVYMAIYEKNFIEKEAVKPVIIDSEKKLFNIADNKNILFFGSGTDKFSEILKHNNINYLKDYSHSSSHMAQLSFNEYSNNNFIDIAYFEPLYLKLFDKIINK